MDGGHAAAQLRAWKAVSMLLSLVRNHGGGRGCRGVGGRRRCPLATKPPGGCRPPDHQR